MRKKNRKVEIDVDGVLANMDGAYAPHVKHLIPDFTESKYVKSWAMKEVGEASPEALEIIKKLWVTPDFIGGLHRFPGVEEGMRILTSIPNLDIVVHTHILDNDDVVKRRYQWIKKLEKDSGGDFTIDICVGASKTMRTDTHYIIEDSVRNLNNSSAKVKFLVRRCHNRNFDEDDIVSCEASQVVKSFNEAARLIYQDMMGVAYGSTNIAK